MKFFHPAVQRWFVSVFREPTRAQQLGWPLIESGQHTLILAPTGSGKTLAAFLSAINHLMFTPAPERMDRCRVLYISPLKALAVDVERNLRAPLAGISVAAHEGELQHMPTAMIRTGDTPSRERAHFARNPTDILITTPESLYLMLTSEARETLRPVRWVIVDEIHAMVASKRGAHLAVSLERLQEIVRQPVQRIGLSATQKPLEEVARFLGGGEFDANNGVWTPRPVTIVDAGSRKELDVLVDVPVEDMSKLGEVVDEIPSGPAGAAPARRSIWPSLYPQILQLIRTHRTTLIFVNNRRLAERTAAALNELAETDLVRAHHGSVAREQRLQIEADLKDGRLAAIVATSSLELGIDMGAIDLVIQIESPISVASGLQRIGRAGHRAGEASKGVIFPKFRGDLIACAASTRQMIEGNVEPMQYQRSPLDVLAQQIVAILSMEEYSLEHLEAMIRRCAPFAELSRGMLEGVLDMLSGRYPSDSFAELRPRIVWDRIAGKLRAREGAKRIAIANGGTIPDRGLYGVFLAGADPGKGRVGELDEEMVFETKIGETFLLGATSWRVEDITFDRVIVSPAPGMPGKMPFWKGDAAGRPVEFGRYIGTLIRDVRSKDAKAAMEMLMQHHHLSEWAANNLVAYIKEQEERTNTVPDDQTIVVERYIDELGDWRVCILSTFGARVHAPWTHAIEARIRRELDLHVETLWTDDGIVIRLPDTEEPPPTDLFVLDPEDVEQTVIDHMGSSALFASHFREAAARALLLPRRFPGQRAPLWQQRKRAADLLQVASRFPNFPIILETYREVLRDVFDMPGLRDLLRSIRSRAIRVVTVNSQTPSPFASSLMFGYVGNFIYDEDAPLAERRAQALSVDHAQLRELLGESELRELLDPEVVASIELQLQHLDERYRIKNPDALHDLLLRLGDLSTNELEARSTTSSNTLEEWLAQLTGENRIAPVTVAGEQRWIAAEDAGRYRDAIGISPPAGIPLVFLEHVDRALEELAARYARTHGPFYMEDVAARFGIPRSAILQTLSLLEASGRVVQGEFRRGKSGREWCDSGVLSAIRQKSLARLRREIEPVSSDAYGRFLPEWHGIGSNRKGADALLEAIEQIQGYPIPASVLESQVLRARVKDYDPRDLDLLMSSGVVVWTGVEPIAQNDGRIALYVSEHAHRLLKPLQEQPQDSGLHAAIRDHLQRAGASFFPQLLEATGGAFKQDVVDALWALVWAGEVTNDTLMPLRAMVQPKKQRRKKSTVRTAVPPEAAGRWSLLHAYRAEITPSQQLTATALQLLNRLGIVTREAIASEKIVGGFSIVYPVFKVMEESGKIRRGYFVEGRGAAQFALPGAIERLRGMRDIPDRVSALILASTDPANPYGSTLPWPKRNDNLQPGRVAGSEVILVNGALAGYLTKRHHSLLTFLPDEEPDRQIVIAALARVLSEVVETGKRRALYLTEIDGHDPAHSPLAEALLSAGFVPFTRGWQKTQASRLGG